MDADALQAQIKMLQQKYTALLTQAAQEGRTADVQSLSNQMQQEIQSLINGATQSAVSGSPYASPVGGDEDQGVEELVEENQENDLEESDPAEAEDEDWDDDEAEDDDCDGDDADGDDWA